MAGNPCGPVKDRALLPHVALGAEYQHVAVGDLICDGPDYASYFRVLRVDPGHAVVYRSIRHPRRGSLMIGLALPLWGAASWLTERRRRRDSGTAPSQDGG